MRSATIAVALALALPLAAGCVSGPQGSIAFETVDKGPNSGIEDQRTVVVRNQSAFQDLWAEHTSNAEGDPGIPNVDFDEEMVVAIFKGESPNGCHGAEITNVTGDGSQITVEGAWVVVESGACTQQITYPFHIAKIDRYENPVAFDVTNETRQSGGSPDDGNQSDGGETGGGDPGPGDQGSYTCRKQGSDEPAPSSGENASFEELDRGQQSGIQEVCLTVARNETAWRDLWTAHQSRSDPAEDRPSVNFSQSMVVAVFKGESPDGCHGAEIESLAVNGSTLHVAAAFFHVEGTACTEAITYPFHIVETDRHETVRFHVEEETRTVQGS